jgi:hypothetical protein
MGEPFIGLTGADGARERRPEPGVSSDMHAARPASMCGSINLNGPSASSSPGSVANLFIIVTPTSQQTERTSNKEGKRNLNVHALQGRQHQEAIAERVVLCHLIQSVARIVCVDSTGKDWVICYRCTEHAA